jgi:predicted nucleic acid-binding protein
VSVVGIDAMILVYAGKVPSKGASPLAELTVRSRRLLDRLVADDATIVLPTVAVSELLVPVPNPESGMLIRELSEQFVCPTFDMRAAAIAAELWAIHKKLPRDQQYKDRHVLRADAMIIASAKAVGATIFYSNDRNCRKLAANIMTAEGLPEKPRDLEEQFVDIDIRGGVEPPPRVKKAKVKKARRKDEQA